MDLPQRARSRGADPGGADAASGFPRGVRGVSRQAGAEVPVKADRGVSRSGARGALPTQRVGVGDPRARSDAPRPATDDEARPKAQRDCCAQIGARDWLHAHRSRRTCAPCASCARPSPRRARSPMPSSRFRGSAPPLIARRAPTSNARAGCRDHRRPRDGRLCDDRTRRRLRCGGDADQRRREGDAWLLDGEKHLISNAGIADVYLVFAKTSPGTAAVASRPSWSPRTTPGLDVCRRAGAWRRRIRSAGCASRLPRAGGAHRRRGRSAASSSA